MKKRILAFSAITIISAIIFCSCGRNESSYEYTEEPTTKPIEVVIPRGNYDCKGDYRKVEQSFRDSGFAKVITDGKGDLLSKDKEKDGHITEVTVDGKKSFKKGEKVMSDVEVKIVHHSMKTAYIPFKAEEAEGENYEDIITQLKEKGFTNIKTKTVEDSSKENETVKSVSVNGETDYESFYSYVVDSKIVVTYYTKSEKSESKKESKSESKSESRDSGSSIVSKIAEGTVTLSFKAYMDSYEEFIDKYIDLMKNYNKDPIKFATQYIEYVQKLSEFTDKLAEYDEDEMSTADWLYYTQVVNRVNKKLAEVN